MAGPAHRLEGGEEQDITCLLIPIGEAALLLPNVTIAEILPRQRLDRTGELPRWCAGRLDWRGRRLPVLSFTALNGGEDDDAQSARCILVMNRVRHVQGLPFYALLADALPRLMHLGPGDVENRRVALGPAEAAAVTVATDTAVVPNLTVIESAARELA